jgi:RND superfamily putative drug exporter
MALLLSRLGAFSHRHRLAVVLVWLVVLIGGGVGAATLGGTTSSTFSIPGQESTLALDKITEEFGAGGGPSAQVVVRAPDGTTLTSGPQAAAVQALVSELGSLPGVVVATDPFDPAAPAVDADRTTAYSTVTYAADAEGVSVDEQDALLAAVDAARNSGLTVEVAGQALQEAHGIGGPG